ncbi:integrin beta pat-3-like [Lineus longissimus]|uniref:integrin beta pat-3-like n=1 Tax=Lineus longissimus TaxID=88925 RepID=UPI00315D7181
MSDPKMLFVIFVVIFKTSAITDICSNESTCGKCIAAAPNCAWCQLPGFDRLPFNRLRCDTNDSLVSFGCPTSDVISPDHEITILKDEAVRDGNRIAEPIQLKPQAIHLKIRPNKPLTFSLMYREADNYPTDLYYLMDLSMSMLDDKKKLAGLGTLLAERMSGITENFRLGFGSFVDKRVSPFNSDVANFLKVTPSCRSTKCVEPYGFRNHLSLTENTTLFSDQVKAARVAPNLDSPEGGFDAMMQAVVCDDIGWRETARKILVLSTDETWHMAGDGKLAGIVTPHDGKCHLDETGFYTESTTMDYPSIGQLSAAIHENNVNVIFAVTKYRLPLYKELSALIEGSTSGELADDSSNVVDLVQDNYNKITSKVTLKTEGAEGIKVSFKSSCFGSEMMNYTNMCENIKIGSNVTFEVTVLVEKCPKDKSSMWRNFTIRPVGLSDGINIQMELLCDCDCQKPNQTVPDNQQCSGGNGTYDCGQCTCKEERYGKNCECDGSQFDIDVNNEQCKQTNSSSVCSGKGSCVCGVCECDVRGRGQSNQHYTGEFCQCDDFSCNYAADNGKICGGPERGTCVCGECQCAPGFDGTTCECPTSIDSCIGGDDGLVCNGKGVCSCGVCECSVDAGYSGPTCSECLTCDTHGCDIHTVCVQCTVFQTGPHDSDKCSQECTKIEIVSELDETDETKICSFIDDDGCRAYFHHEYDPDGNLTIKAQRTKACNAPDNVIAIASGVIASIVFIGLLLLITWKVAVTTYDKREFAKFESERLNAKWNTEGNPLYKKPTSTFNNPAYFESMNIKAKET